jgi:hypothetical protein
MGVLVKYIEVKNEDNTGINENNGLQVAIKTL